MQKLDFIVSKILISDIGPCSFTRNEIFIIPNESQQTKYLPLNNVYANSKVVQIIRHVLSTNCINAGRITG